MPTSRITGPALLIVALGGSALAQPSGTYRGTAWEINENHTLKWGGQPYLPVGARIPGNVAAIDAAKAAGITDVLVELPASGQGWKEAFAALEARGMRYLLAVNSLAPGALGYAVEPSGYRINGVKGPRELAVKLPGVLAVFGILALRSDGSVTRSFELPVEDGWLRTRLAPGNDLENTFLMYPRTRSLGQPDFWEGLDEHRDNLLIALKRTPPGPGLRGIVNPLGETTPTGLASARFVPASAFFQLELRGFLEQKYKNLETALRAWGMGASFIDSWEEMARVVPLWSGTRGVSQVWDPVSKGLASCDSRKSTAWTDIGEVLATSASRRLQRLVVAVRSLADVPVIQEWSGWSPAYERQDPSLDGIAARVRGFSPSEVVGSTGRAASTVLRWPRHGLLFATEMDLPTGAEAPTTLKAVAEDLGSLGLRGLFARADNPEARKLIAGLAAERAADTTLATYGPTAFYFPENASNPAVAQRLPGGRWWLPAPFSGDRLDFGAPYEAYRMEDPRGGSIFAIWRTDGVGRVKFAMNTPKSATIVTADGSDAQPKISKEGLEITVGQSPLFILGSTEVPVPIEAFVRMQSNFEVLKKKAEDAKLNTTEETFLFRDNINSFKENPGGTFTTLRKLYRKLAYALGKFVWIEAESARDNTFSEALALPGCSNGSVLNLKTEIGQESQTYQAEYSIPSRTEEEQEIWIAARIPAERRGDLVARIGSQEFRILGDPLSLYANGFGWYRLGTTRLSGAPAKLVIEVSSPRGADLALDAILVTPGSFRPNGVFPPEN